MISKLFIRIARGKEIVYMGAIILSFFALVVLCGCATSTPAPDIEKISTDIWNNSYTNIPGEFSVDTAVERALQNSSEILQLRADVDIAVNQKSAAGDLRDPELRFMYGENNSDSSRYGVLPGVTENTLFRNSTSDSSRWRAAVRFFTDNPWVRAGRISAADAMLQVKIADLRVAEQTKSLFVRQKISELIYLKRSLDIIKRQMELYHELFTLINKRIGQGQATAKNISAVSRRYTGSLSEFTRKSKKYREVRNELCGLLNVSRESIDAGIATNNLPVPQKIEMTSMDIQKLLISNRVDFVAESWKMAAARMALKEEKAKRIPWFNYLQFSYGEGSGDTDNSPIISHEDESSDEWRIDTGINMPVFSLFNHSYEQRASEYKRAESLLHKRISDARENVINSIQDLNEEVADYRIIADARNVIESSLKNIMNSQDSKDFVDISITDLQNSLLEIKKIELDMRYNYIDTYFNLQKYLYVGNK